MCFMSKYKTNVELEDVLKYSIAVVDCCKNSGVKIDVFTHSSLGWQYVIVHV